MSTETNSDTDIDSPSVAPTVEQLLAEQAGEFEAASIDGLPPASGETIFQACNTTPLFALSAIALSDGPGYFGKELKELHERTVGRSVSSGTLYPILQEYREDGLLTETCLAQTNRQQINDAAAVDDVLANYEARLRWWLRLCLTARASLDVE